MLNKKKDCINQLIDLGFSNFASKLTADVLSFAEHNNRLSHGYRLIENIRKCVNQKIINKELILTRKLCSNGITEINCHNSIGYASAVIACRYAISLAKKSGICVSVLVNIDHIGALKYYSSLIAKRNCVGIISVNGKPRIPLYGTSEPMMGATPISIAIPAKDKQLSIDLCLAKKSINEIIKYESYDFYIGLDKNGNPSNISKEVLDGSLFAIGNEKGAALSFALKLIMDGVGNGISIGNHPVFMVIFDASKIPGFVDRVDSNLKNANNILKRHKNSRLPGALFI